MWYSLYVAVTQLVRPKEKKIISRRAVVIKKRSKINIIFVFERRESIDSKLGKNDIGVVVE